MKITPKTETFFVLVTDGLPRLVFRNEQKGQQYLVQTLKTYPQTKLFKVYGDTTMEEIEN